MSWLSDWGVVAGTIVFVILYWPSDNIDNRHPNGRPRRGKK